MITPLESALRGTGVAYPYPRRRQENEIVPIAMAGSVPEPNRQQLVDNAIEWVKANQQQGGSRSATVNATESAGVGVGGTPGDAGDATGSLDAPSGEPGSFGFSIPGLLSGARQGAIGVGLNQAARAMGIPSN